MINQKKPVDGKTGKDSRAGIHAASASEPVVDIWDGNTHLGQAVVRNGMWSHTVTNFGEGTHRIKATTGSVASSLWTFQISTFAMANTQMVLNGYAVTTSYPLSGRDVPNNAQVRVPTGGVQPYTYRSSAPNVATVNAAGKVTGMGNGTATITVSDALGRSISYPVIVSHVYRLIENRGPFNYNTALAWIQRQPGVFVPPNRAQMDAFLDLINTKYSGGWAFGYPHWYGPSALPATPYGFIHTGGYATGASPTIDWENIKGAICLVLT